VGVQGAAGVPWHTFVVNASGAFAIGLLLVLSTRLGWPGWWRPLIAVGVLGGYTTFSTFSLEIVDLASRGHSGLAAGYAAGSLAAGVAGCALGMAVGRVVA
jgi:CrcB protein